MILHSRRGRAGLADPLLLAIVLFALVALGTSDDGLEVSLPFWALAALFFSFAVLAAGVPVWVSDGVRQADPRLGSLAG